MRRWSRRRCEWRQLVSPVRRSTVCVRSFIPAVEGSRGGGAASGGGRDSPRVRCSCNRRGCAVGMQRTTPRQRRYTWRRHAVATSSSRVPQAIERCPSRRARRWREANGAPLPVMRDEPLHLLRQPHASAPRLRVGDAEPHVGRQDTRGAAQPTEQHAGCRLLEPMQLQRERHGAARVRRTPSRWRRRRGQRATVRGAAAGCDIAVVQGPHDTAGAEPPLRSTQRELGRRRGKRRGAAPAVVREACRGAARAGGRGAGAVRFLRSTRPRRQWNAAAP